MFNVGFPELLVIFAVALLAIGPDRLPELARKLGKLSADLRRQTDGLRREFYNEVYKPIGDIKNTSTQITGAVNSFGRNLINDSEFENCETAKKTEEVVAAKTDVPVLEEAKIEKIEEQKEQ